MSRYDMIYMAQSLGLILAANACANLSMQDAPVLEKFLLGLGLGCLVAGMFGLFRVIA